MCAATRTEQHRGGAATPPTRTHALRTRTLWPSRCLNRFMLAAARAFGAHVHRSPDAHHLRSRCVAHRPCRSPWCCADGTSRRTGTGHTGVPVSFRALRVRWSPQVAPLAPYGARGSPLPSRPLYASPAGRVGEAVDGELSAAAVAPYRAATPRPADFNLGQVPRLGIGRVAPRS